MDLMKNFAIHLQNAINKAAEENGGNNQKLLLMHAAVLLKASVELYTIAFEEDDRPPFQSRKRYQHRIERFLGPTSTTQQFSAQDAGITLEPCIDQQLDDCYAIFWISSIVGPLGLAIIVVACVDGGLNTEHVMKHLASAFFWGTLVRILACQEMANINNSFGHWIGYQNHATPDNSRNNLLTGWLMFGEGFHNNHHHAPNAWNMGQQWYEVDLGACVLRILFTLQLARPR